MLAIRASDSTFCSPQPPTPETDYPESLTSYPEEDYSPVGSFGEPGPTSPLTTPPGWSCHISQDKQTLYTNHFTQEQVGEAGRWTRPASESSPQPSSLIGRLSALNCSSHTEPKPVKRITCTCPSRLPGAVLEPGWRGPFPPFS